MKQYIVEVIENLNTEHITPENLIMYSLIKQKFPSIEIISTNITCRYYSQEQFIEEFVENITQCYEGSAIFTPMRGCVDGMWFNMFQNEELIQVNTYGSQGDYLNKDPDDNGGGITFYTADEDMTHDRYRQQAEFALELIGLSI